MSTIPSNQPESSTNEYAKPPFIRRVRIQGYKSIAFCDVELQPLTILVGRNGSGKSNFLDALAFLKDAMQTNVKEAVSRHGGLSNMICRSVESDGFSIEIEMNVQKMGSNDFVPARYAIRIIKGNQRLPGGAEEPEVEWETFRFRQGIKDFKFDRNQTESNGFPGATEDSSGIKLFGRDILLLRSLGSSPALECWNQIDKIGMYNFNPKLIRDVQRIGDHYFLEEDGKNLAASVMMLMIVDQERLKRVKNYLSTIGPEIEGFEAVKYGKYATIRFQMRGKKEEKIEFEAASMSDGTLRALASLIAAFQVNGHVSNYPSIVGIEEPETALHPAAIRALVDALDEATQDTQIILTTHSPDLIRDPDIRPSQLLAVRKVDGETRISPIDPASRSAIEDHLYNAGELLQMDQLDIDEEDIERQRKEKYLGSEV